MDGSPAAATFFALWLRASGYGLPRAFRLWNRSP
jgi:hypothetical protein